MCRDGSDNAIRRFGPLAGVVFREYGCDVKKLLVYNLPVSLHLGVVRSILKPVQFFPQHIRCRDKQRSPSNKRRQVILEPKKLNFALEDNDMIGNNLRYPLMGLRQTESYIQYSNHSKQAPTPLA